MRRFEVVDAGSFQEAAKRAAAKDTDVMAGGTDILNVYNKKTERLIKLARLSK